VIIPRSQRARNKLAEMIVVKCHSSRGHRESAYRIYGQWIERGWASDDGAGGLALANLLYSHTDRLAAHLYSPIELLFAISFEERLKKDWLERGQVGGRAITDEWVSNDIDLLFGAGVKPAVDYGACILKQLVGQRPDDNGHLQFEYHGARLVMPQMFGVMNETINDLDKQEAFVETMMLNEWEVWRRIRHLPDAEKLMKRIKSNSEKQSGVSPPTSFMHQVLSTAVLELSPAAAGQPRPGGWVQTGGGNNYPNAGPQVDLDLYPVEEITVWDDDSGDWTTLVWMQPDILISPLSRPINMCVPGHHPYTLIQANFEPGYFWGRSEVADLMQLQAWLTTHLSDINKIMGQQFDKFIAYSGADGINAEEYAMQKAQGFVNLGAGGNAVDLTARMPENALPLIREIISLMERVSGFPPIMSGAGESGVRSDVHANTLMKTGSPRLRDRSLLIERQCAKAGALTLAVLAAKGTTVYWTDANDELTDFTLAQMVEMNARVSVDSHSSSPIYHDDHLQLVAFLLKSGALDPISALEMVNIPNRDLVIARAKERMAQQQAQLQKLEQEDPEAYAKVIRGTGHKRAA